MWDSVCFGCVNCYEMLHIYKQHAGEGSALVIHVQSNTCITHLVIVTGCKNHGAVYYQVVSGLYPSVGVAVPWCVTGLPCLMYAYRMELHSRLELYIVGVCVCVCVCARTRACLCEFVRANAYVLDYECCVVLSMM